MRRTGIPAGRARGSPSTRKTEGSEGGTGLLEGPIVLVFVEYYLGSWGDIGSAPAGSL
jgi:hypothetical protein